MVVVVVGRRMMVVATVEMAQECVMVEMVAVAWRWWEGGGGGRVERRLTRLIRCDLSALACGRDRPISPGGHGVNTVTGQPSFPCIYIYIYIYNTDI